MRFGGLVTTTTAKLSVGAPMRPPRPSAGIRPDRSAPAPRRNPAVPVAPFRHDLGMRQRGWRNRALLRVWPYLRPYRRHLAVIVASSVLSTAAQVALPLIVKAVIDGPLRDGDRAGIVRWCLVPSVSRCSRSCSPSGAASCWPSSRPSSRPRSATISTRISSASTSASTTGGTRVSCCRAPRPTSRSCGASSASARCSSC